MPRYFFEISYDGSAYQGWHSQKNGQTVQEAVEQSLEKVFKHKINAIGCGRTDAGVHGLQYVFHADVPLITNQHLAHLNRHLPTDIAIHQVHEVANNVHAQKSATQRTYHYFFHTQKQGQKNRFSTWVPQQELDLDLLKTACTFIKANKDFKQFCLTPDQHKSTECRIDAVELYENNGQYLVVFKANRFLKSMIRLLVGELLEVAQGKTSLDAFKAYLNQQMVKPKHHKAAPQGLHFAGVTFPFLEIKATVDLRVFTEVD